MTYKSYNFRKPDRPAGTVEQRLTLWLRAACALAAERSGRHLPFRLEMALHGIDTTSPIEALSHLPEPAIGYRVAFAGESASMLFVWPRPLALALVGGALGETPTAMPADRELTLVELSLCEFLMQDLLASVLQETWTGATALSLSVAEREPSPRWTRLFVKAEQIVQCVFTLRGPFGEQQGQWLAPRSALQEQIGRNDSAVTSLLARDAPRKLEALVRELPIEVRVDLGAVQLPISQLAGLAPGDLLILNQRVSEPLIARVDNRPKFRGWPGRIGSRQSLQIDSLYD